MYVGFSRKIFNISQDLPYPGRREVALRGILMVGRSVPRGPLLLTFLFREDPKQQQFKNVQRIARNLSMTLIFPQLAAISLLLAADITDAIDCTGKLIRTVSGPSSTCDGFETSSNAHYWPLVDGCHGWKATSVQDGSVHENSANNIRCSDDGTRLLYDQWAGSLDCTNSGFGSTSKEFVWNECHQGIPSRLYDMGINLDCCLDPDGHSCLQSYTGVPRVDGVGTADEEIYWNGERCDDESDNVVTGEEAPTASPTAPPTAVTYNENGRPTENATGGPGWMIAGWWRAVVSLFNV